jgi:hypothetical protein
MMVVRELITSCHVSEKPKIGPVTPHTTIVARATPNPHELPGLVDLRPPGALEGRCLLDQGPIGSRGEAD